VVSPAVFAALLLVRRRVGRTEEAFLVFLYAAYVAIAIVLSS
jgi:hypothetical protein